MNWVDYIGDNKKTIDIIFGNKTPELNNIEIRDITIGYQYSNAVEVVFDLCQYPSNPPLKWKQKGENEISIKLLFSEIEKFRSDLWECQYDKKSDIKIKPVNEKFDISFTGISINMSFTANWISMLDFHSYKHEAR